MASFTPALTGPVQASITLLTGLFSNQAASSSSSSQPINSCRVYIGAEPNFHLEVSQVVDCFKRQSIDADEKNLSTATHFVLFVTDSLLKSKERIFPLIERFNADPHFKQRLFPFIMGKLSIF